MANTIWIVRTILLSVSLLFSLITMGLAAGYIGTLFSYSRRLEVIVPDFSALSLAVAIISMLCLAPMLIVDFIRRGAFTSWIIIEVAVTGVLSILWLAAAADTASATAGVSIDCSGTAGLEATLCRTYQGVEAFTFLNWIILFAYHGIVLGLALYGMVRGNKTIWKGTVRDTDFFAKGANAAAPGPQAGYGQSSYAPSTAYSQQTATAYYPPPGVGGQYPPASPMSVSKIEV